jgi:hypothetical protein
MTEDALKTEAASFWKTLPGVITALTGLIAALTALVTAVYPMIQVSGQGKDSIPLKEFVKRTVLEGGTYKIQDGDAGITLVVDDIKVQRHLVFASFALGNQSPKKLEIEAGKTQLLVLGSKEYMVSVHDFADVIVGADTAQLTLALK